MVNKDSNSNPHKNRLGEILIERGIITHDQLERALDQQKKQEGYIGEVLVRLGFVEEQDVVVALVVQCNLPYIAVDKYEIDEGIINLIDKTIAQKLRVIPLDRVGDILSVVMQDPLDQAAKAELQRLTNCKIAPFIATKTEIENAIKKWFR